MDVLVLIGRILFAALFLPAALNHFTSTDAMTGYAQARGVPAARAAVIGGGVLLLLGGLSVLLGIWPDLGALLLAVFLIPTALLMHAFWKETDPQAKQMKECITVKQGYAGLGSCQYNARARYIGVISAPGKTAP